MRATHKEFIRLREFFVSAGFFPERIDASFSTCSGFRWLVRSSRVANKDGIFSGTLGALRRVIYRDAKRGFVRKPNQNANVTEKFIPDSGSHLTQKAVSAHARLNESS